MDTLTTRDIAADLKVSERYIRKLAKNNEIPTITKPFKGGFIYSVPASSYFDWKKNRNDFKKANGYLSNQEFLKEKQEEWLNWCKNGALTGKALSDKTIELYCYCMGKYWQLLPRRYSKSVLISKENVRSVLASIDIKSFSIKDNLYKAIRSFIKYLAIKGYVNNTLLSDLKELKPKRVYPPKKSHCTQEQVELLLKEASKEASKKYIRQTDYDVILNSATIATIVFAGLRASELCNLRLQDIDLVNRKLFVYLGKGKKNRVVGICNRLYDYLDKYLKARPKTNIENFFVTYSNINGKNPVPITKDILTKKLKRLATRIRIGISLHGLRRTFATIAANAGKPINIISLALGHADLKTTQGYLMTTQDEVIKEMQGW